MRKDVVSQLVLIVTTESPAQRAQVFTKEEALVPYLILWADSRCMLAASCIALPAFAYFASPPPPTTNPLNPSHVGALALLAALPLTIWIVAR